MLLLLLACALMVRSAQAAVIAVDLGSEFLKVSIVKPGRTPISIVLNEMSKRKTSSQVAFVNGDRLLGEEAAVLQPRFPDRVFTSLRNFLGAQAGQPEVTQLLQAQHLPYRVAPVADRGTIAFTPADGEAYTVEEAVASLLHYAKGLGQTAADGAPIVDIVITVPAWFGQAQRQALLDAAGLAGLNVLSLVNSHAAAALQYGIERNFANKSEHVLFYDVGSSSTQAALVRFSSFDIKEAGKVNTYSQFETVDTAAAPGTGAADLDTALIRHFAKEFDEQHMGGKGSVLDHPRAVAKLRKQAKRVKQVLSANSEAPLSVEELHNGVDFRSRITREDFEAIAGDFFARAAAPLRTLLQRNPEAARNLSAVELLGGGTRVPRLQAVLSEALGGRVLDRHLDADEAVVLGAALYAANLSTTFRLRKFGMSDGITYPVAFKLEETPGTMQNENGTAYVPKPLLPFGKRLPAKRVVHLANITSDPVKLQLLVGPPSPDARVEDASELLASFELTGLDEVKAKYNDTGKLSTHFRADSSGIVTFDKAEVILERTEMVNVTVPVPSNTTANITNDAAAKDGKAATKAVKADKKGGKKGDAAAAEAAKDAAGAATAGDGTAKATAGGAANATAGGNATVAEPKTMVVQRERRRTIRVPLKIGGPGFVRPGLSDEQRKVLMQRMRAVQAADDAKRAAAHAKNDLESYIIGTRSALQDDEAVAAVTTDKQRDQFLAQLNDAEDWLYDAGENAPATEHQARLAKLRAVGDPISFRKEEVGRRAALTAKADKFVGLATGALGDWPKSKPWLNETDLAEFGNQVKEFQKWFMGQQAAQAKMKPHEEPAYKAADASARLDALRKAFAKLKNRKKPKPPPPPAAAGNATANGIANATADGNATDAKGAGGKRGTKGGDGKGGDQKAEDQKSWDELLKGMDPEGRARMEELLKNLRTGKGPGGSGGTFGGKGGPQFMNIEDVLKQTKGMEGGAAGGAADSEFADGLDEHDEL